MLNTIGQGVALDAIVKLGFCNTHDDFDVARFFKRDDAGHEVDIDVTCELLPGPVPTQRAAAQDPLPMLLAELELALAKVNFHPDEQFRRATGRIRFTRIDCLTRMGQPLVTATHVYATYRHCIGSTTI